MSNMEPRPAGGKVGHPPIARPQLSRDLTAADRETVRQHGHHECHNGDQLSGRKREPYLELNQRREHSALFSKV